jgi:hypothetical protein
VSSGQLATVSVKKLAAFWRTSTKSSWVISWIERGYELQWIDGAPPPKIAKNSPSALSQESFVTSAVEEMLAAGAILILPKEERPEGVSPLGFVPKGTEGKFRLIINMR